ncbi:MAG TPA: cupin domain-containing protein, partial [Aquabacterium sp.]|nr:cupin domain-containing protein [Aquabacterium sp.]
REHEGDEFVMALSGTVELRLTNRSEILESGDSAYFRGGVAHYFRTIGPEPAQILVIISGASQT